MEPLSNQGFYENPAQTGSSKVVPIHFRNGTELELDGSGLELGGSGLELPPSQVAEGSIELIGVISVLDQIPRQIKALKAHEYFPWSAKHIRSNLIPSIADGLRIGREALLCRGTLTEEGIDLLASYEQCCGNKVSIFVDGARIDVRPRAEDNVPQSFDAWIQDRLQERRQAAQQIPPINPNSATPTDTAIPSGSTPEAALTVGEDFNIDAFIDQQLNEMGGVEESAIGKLEEVEAELVDADQGFEDLNTSSDLLRQRQIAAKAVEDAADDERLYSETYLATRRRIRSRRAQSQQPGKPHGGNAPGAGA